MAPRGAAPGLIHAGQAGPRAAVGCLSMLGLLNVDFLHIYTYTYGIFSIALRIALCCESSSSQMAQGTRRRRAQTSGNLHVTVETHAPTASTAGCADVGTLVPPPGKESSRFAAQCSLHTSSFTWTWSQALRAWATHSFLKQGSPSSRNSASEPRTCTASCAHWLHTEHGDAHMWCSSAATRNPTMAATCSTGAFISTLGVLFSNKRAGDVRFGLSSIPQGAMLRASRKL